MPILDSRSLEFFSRSPEQTRRLGIRLGAMLKVSDVVCLSGELGAGKTTLVQGVAQGWGSLDSVSSPTFVLCNQYRRPDGKILHHLDAYRLNTALEGEDLDLDLMVETGALVVEWAERIQPALPKDFLLIKMRWLADEQRGMIFLPHGARYERLLADFRRQSFGG
jgi:tRNA threonylcarbamoyladenosine biosynthesis protein TsaE